jgi:hypothetical protein
MFKKPKSPLTPLCQRGELQGIALKVPLWKRGIEGDLKIRKWNEFLANAISDPADKNRQDATDSHHSSYTKKQSNDDYLSF